MIEKPINQSDIKLNEKSKLVLKKRIQTKKKLIVLQHMHKNKSEIFKIISIFMSHLTHSL